MRPPLYSPPVECLPAKHARYRRPEFAGTTHALYDDVTVLAVDPISKLMRLDSCPVRLEIHMFEKESLGAHYVIIWVNRPARVAYHVGSHS